MAFELPPHQQRVHYEAQQLTERIKKLEEFIHAPASDSIFISLTTQAQDRLRRQLDIMRQYQDVLRERIGGFMLGEQG